MRCFHQNFLLHLIAGFIVEFSGQENALLNSLKLAKLPITRASAGA
jgi:hypothetical protein